MQKWGKIICNIGEKALAKNKNKEVGSHTSRISKIIEKRIISYKKRSRVYV
jgi:hypothetical protein